jgi:hypothetical protein
VQKLCEGVRVGAEVLLHLRRLSSDRPSSLRQNAEQDVQEGGGHLLCSASAANGRSLDFPLGNEEHRARGHTALYEDVSWCLSWHYETLTRESYL